MRVLTTSEAGCHWWNKCVDVLSGSVPDRIDMGDARLEGRILDLESAD
ncbi:MAG: hypothetical protein MJZ38_06350 [archaeon]|nr:hypothetical protein [archaeon]